MMKIAINIAFIILLETSLFSQNIDSLKNLLNSVDKNEKVDLLLSISTNYLRTAPENALPYITEAIELANKIGYHKGESFANLRAGFVYATTGKYGKALDYFNIALDLAQKHNLYELEATSLNSIGNFYYLTGKQLEALSYYNRALEIGREINFYTGMLNNLNNLGIIYGNLGDYEKSISKYIESLTISEKINDKTGAANTYINIGTIYYEMNDFNNAMENYKKSYELGLQLNDLNIVATCLINIGIINNKKGEYEEALKDLNKALEINEERGNKTGIANALTNIGLIYYNLNSLDTSLVIYKKALAILEEIGNQEGTAATLLQMSILLRDKKKYNEALYNLHKAVPIAENVNLKLLTDIYYATSKTYAEMGNYKPAFEYSKKYNMMRDSLFTINNLKNVTELQTKYDFEKKEQEIELLTRNKQIKELELSNEKIIRNTFIAGFIGLFLLLFLMYNRYRIKNKSAELLEIQNNKIKLQSDELQKLNASKDKFFSIIAHDLRNPFNSLLGFSEILKNEMEDLTKDERQEYSLQLYESSSHVLNLVNNLLEWAELQKGKMGFEPVNLKLQEEVQEILNIVKGNAIKKNISLLQSIDDKIFILADKRMLHSIILNLVSNAIKFSHLGGVINITADKTETKAIISIEDQGVGMSSTALDNLFKIDHASSSKGTQNETGTGLGLILCKEMVDLHNGNISAESELGKGTTFKIVFPKNNN